MHCSGRKERGLKLERPKNLTEMDLNTHPYHDAMAVIQESVYATNPQSVEAHKAENYANHIYQSMFASKESQLVFFLTLGYLIRLGETMIEERYGVKVTKAVIPK